MIVGSANTVAVELVLEEYSLAVIRHYREYGSDGLLLSYARRGEHWITVTLADTLNGEREPNDSRLIVKKRKKGLLGRILSNTTIALQLIRIKAKWGMPLHIIAGSAELAMLCEAIFGRSARRGKSLYLFSDVTRFHMSPIFGRIAEYIERFCTDRGWIPCVTSPGFYFDYLSTRGLSNSAYLVHNTSTMMPVVVRNVEAGGLKVVWCGLLRCRQSLRIFGELLASFPGTQIRIAGKTDDIRGDDFDRIIHDENVEVLGPYTEAQLPEIYRDADFTWACDWSSELPGRVTSNSALLLPNRLYQGIKGGVPIIASEGSWVARIVSSYDIGIVIPRDPQTAVDAIRSLTELDRSRWKKNLLGLRESPAITENPWERLFNDELLPIGVNERTGKIFF